MKKIDAKIESDRYLCVWTFNEYDEAKEIWHLSTYRQIKDLLLILCAREFDRSHYFLQRAVVAEKLHELLYGNAASYQEIEYGYNFSPDIWIRARKTLGEFEDWQQY